MSLNQTINDHDDTLAAEYALGTLPYGERIDLEKRIKTDDILRHRVEWWASSLIPMTDDIEETTAPKGVWKGINEKLFADTKSANIFFWNSLGLWRGLTAALFASIIVLSALFIQTQNIDKKTEPAPIFVAQMIGDNSALAVSALYDETSSTLKLTRTAGIKEQGRDFELWVIPKGKAAISLGVLSSREATSVSISPELQAAFSSETVLAVTDEPEGGSPSGVATGAILAAGTLVKI